MSGIKSYIESLIEKCNEYDKVGLTNNIFSDRYESNISCYCTGPKDGETLCPCQLKNQKSNNENSV